MSEQGDKARKALHDIRWGPHIESVVERQENMDDAIRVALKTIAALEAKLSKMDELESERDMLRTVINDTDKAELLEALEQSTKEALALRERVEELETEGCGQCEACEDFFPLSLLSITDDGVALCPGDWDEVLAATAELAEEEAV